MLLGGLAYGLIAGRPEIALMLGFGSAYVLLGSRASQTTLAWLQLQLSHRVPLVRLIPFLEDGVSLTKLPGTAIRGIPPGQRTAAAALRCSRQRPTRKTISVVTSSNSRVCGS